MKRSRSFTVAWVPTNPGGQGEDDDWMGGYQLSAVAYQRKGTEAEALLATARKHFHSGNAMTSAMPRSRQARPGQVLHAARAAG